MGWDEEFPIAGSYGFCSESHTPEKVCVWLAFYLVGEVGEEIDSVCGDRCQLGFFDTCSEGLSFWWFCARCGDECGEYIEGDDGFVVDFPFGDF